MQMNVKRKRWWILLAISLACLALSQSRMAATAWAISRPADRFVSLLGDASVFHEPGAEQLAEMVGKVLPAAIGAVEAQHYRPFADPVRVYVCADLNSFESFCPGARSAAG